MRNSELIYVSSNTFTNNSEGLKARYSPEMSITNNICIDNQYGIIAYSCPNSNLTNNTFTKNSEGITISYSPETFIKNNTLLNDGFHILGLDIEDYLGYHFENNRINDKAFGFFINQENISIQNPIYGQLLLINCSEFIIKNQVIRISEKATSL
jgi:parallel beta-helix repeat protein